MTGADTARNESRKHQIEEKVPVDQQILQGNRLLFFVFGFFFKVGIGAKHTDGTKNERQDESDIYRIRGYVIKDQSCTLDAQGITDGSPDPDPSVWERGSCCDLFDHAVSCRDKDGQDAVDDDGAGQSLAENEHQGAYHRQDEQQQVEPLYVVTVI